MQNAILELNHQLNTAREKLEEISEIQCCNEMFHLGCDPPSHRFTDVQMDAVVQNMVMLEKSFDVCYCDGDCFSNKNWFKVRVPIHQASETGNAFEIND